VKWVINSGNPLNFFRMTSILKVCRAAYDYDAQLEDELTFKEGDILYILPDQDENEPEWLKATSQLPGESTVPGNVPSNYLEPAVPLYSAISLYSYSAANEDELSFDEGETLEIIQVVPDDPDWLLAKQIGHSTKSELFGLIPSNYIEKCSPSAIASAAATSSPPTTSPQYVPPVGEKPSSSPYQGAPQLPSQFTAQINPLPEIVSQVPPTGFSPSLANPVPPQQAGPPKIATAQYDFDGNEPDDLSVREGETCLILDDTSDASWCRVRLISSRKDRSGLEGYVPREYLKYKEIAKSPAALGSKPVIPPSMPPAPPVLPPAPINSNSRVKEAENREREIREKERLEQERIEKEEKNRLERERLECERKERERVQKEMSDRQILEKQKLERERSERDRIEMERLERERIEKDRLDRERADRDRIERENSAKNMAEQAAARQKSDALNSAPKPPQLPSRPQNSVTSTQVKPTLNQPIPPAPTITNVVQSQPPVSASIISASVAANGKDMPDPSRVRVWLDQSGVHRTEAAFIHFLNGKVKLHKTNGLKIDVPIEALSKADQLQAYSLQGVTPPPQLMAAERASTIPPSAAPIASSISAVTKSSSGSVVYNGFDWNSYFLSCGVESPDALVYAKRFVAEKMDQEVLFDVNREILKSLDVREGDILRILKQQQHQTAVADREAILAQENISRIEQYFTDRVKVAETAEQLRKDEEFARKLQEEELSRAKGSSQEKSTRTPRVSNRIEPSRSSVPPRAEERSPLDSRRKSMPVPPPQSTLPLSNRGFGSSSNLAGIAATGPSLPPVPSMTMLQSQTVLPAPLIPTHGTSAGFVPTKISDSHKIQMGNALNAMGGASNVGITAQQQQQMAMQAQAQMQMQLQSQSSQPPTSTMMTGAVTMANTGSFLANSFATPVGMSNTGSTSANWQNASTLCNLNSFEAFPYCLHTKTNFFCMVHFVAPDNPFGKPLNAPLSNASYGMPSGNMSRSISGGPTVGTNLMNMGAPAVLNNAMGFGGNQPMLQQTQTQIGFSQGHSFGQVMPPGSYLVGNPLSSSQPVGFSTNPTVAMTGMPPYGTVPDPLNPMSTYFGGFLCITPMYIVLLC
jgi:hypothetical protein